MSIYKGKSRYLWYLSPGHGGLDPDGNYVTAPNKMFQHEEFTAYEGVINRGIVSKLAKKLKSQQISHYELTGYDDFPLSKRVTNANHLQRMRGDVIYLSIHSNAGGGHGNEIYTSNGQTKSDVIANVFGKQFLRLRYPDGSSIKFRADKRDGDLDKESQFYVLRKTLGPALLVECGFFDNLKDAEFLVSEEGQEAYAKALYESIKQVEKSKI